MKYPNRPTEGEKVRQCDMGGYRIVAVGIPGGVRRHWGIAACSPKDAFNRKLGLQIARGRARKAIALGYWVYGPSVDTLRMNMHTVGWSSFLEKAGVLEA